MSAVSLGPFGRPDPSAPFPVAGFRLHIFNPSNDLALAVDAPTYTPPHAVAEMERRMAAFPMRWAREGDVVLTDWHTRYDSLVRQAGHPLLPTPWGWSKALRNRLLRFGVPASLMPTPEELDTWRSCSSRRFAADYIHQLLPLLVPLGIPLAGHGMRFCASLAEWCEGQGSNTPSEGSAYIFKPEYSSSGRGITIGRTPPSGAFPLLADSFLGDKRLDCGLLFHITPDRHVHFLGFSVFYTRQNGTYLRQERASQARLRSLIEEALGTPSPVLDRLISTHIQLLTRTLAPRYRGPLSIDMLIARDPQGRVLLHPCLEINLRMTMGIAWLLEEACRDDRSRYAEKKECVTVVKVSKKSLLCIGQQKVQTQW